MHVLQFPTSQYLLSSGALDGKVKQLILVWVYKCFSIIICSSLNILESAFESGQSISLLVQSYRVLMVSQLPIVDFFGGLGKMSHKYCILNLTAYRTYLPGISIFSLFKTSQTCHCKTDCFILSFFFILEQCFFLQSSIHLHLLLLVPSMLL